MLPASSFVLVPREHIRTEFNWLRIQPGFGWLFQQLAAHISESVWMPVFEDAKVTDLTNPSSLPLPSSSSSSSPKCESLPVLGPGPGSRPDGRAFVFYPDCIEAEALFGDLCDITPSSTTSDNPYLEPAMCLFPLLRLEAHINQFSKLVTFMKVFTRPFLAVLEDKRPAALLLLLYWLTLMRECRQWWIVGRAESEALAIMAYLRGERDDRVQRLLRFPIRMFWGG